MALKDKTLKDLLKSAASTKPPELVMAEILHREKYTETLFIEQLNTINETPKTAFNNSILMHLRKLNKNK